LQAGIWVKFGENNLNIGKLEAFAEKEEKWVGEWWWYLLLQRPNPCSELMV